MSLVAALFVRRDSIYKAMPGVDAFDFDRNALSFAGGMPVVAHPPCRSWGRLRAFVTPAPGERDLAMFAVAQVRKWGGALEHPAGSTLWAAAGLPAPGQRDEFGGWTLPILQSAWRHRADKPTWIYIVGIEPGDLPPMPLRLGRSTHVIAQGRTRKDGTRIRKGDAEEGGDGGGAGPTTGRLYKKSGKTVAKVLAEFKAGIEGAPILSKVKGFFGTCMGGGSCPTATWDGGQYAGKFDLASLCSGPLLQLFQYAGFVFLAGMGVVALRWALL